MNVASLDNCKQLFELSGWKDTGNGFGWIKGAGNELYLVSIRNDEEIKIPAYSLGYLLRKLPATSKIINVSTDKAQIYGALFYDQHGEKSRFELAADTPEDAACKLAIELIKQGVLKS